MGGTELSPAFEAFQPPVSVQRLEREASERAQIAVAHEPGLPGLREPIFKATASDRLAELRVTHRNIRRVPSPAGTGLAARADIGFVLFKLLAEALSSGSFA